MGMNVAGLEKTMIGLVLIFALITFFGVIADDLATAIVTITGSNLDGVVIFGVAGILITLGVLIAVIRNTTSGKR